MKFKMEYLKLNGEITIFEQIEIVGTYEKDLKTEGFKVYDNIREVYRNVRYSGIQTIEAA